ncbi:MAG: cytochrome c oxidase subunit II [SAR202 cluster bacterium]|jgi:cytochrome c oxidase subunit 2|nr:MAG: cytochrome c oxidase subunit II [SAR202 cluster bacterium]KAA1298512.1 MAG: cytochrome c oxidase subunit II [SAR202 cluster bacterium]MQG12296.1 cytochrome c oxidase subunit II [SAR202 cluster bacterium]|tara:strand:- start:3453 stop:4598 length:1146 start_codon:yes stop_codon:yes gene_type:complete
MLSKRIKLIFNLSIVMVLSILLMACNPEGPQSTFDAQGPVSEIQKNLFLFTFWIAVIVFIVVEGAILFVTFRYRRKNDELPVQTHGNLKLEITWTIIPAIIIVIIAIPTVIGIWQTQVMPDEEDSLVINAVGHQWWFEFNYPSEEVVTANELHLPEDTNVIVNIESQDVLHSFWIPKIAGKVDMVPNHENQLWIKADNPGLYYGQCAEFCGVAHAMMRFRVIVHTNEDYQNWLEYMRTPPQDLVSGSDEDEGRKLFVGNCSMCHTYDSYKKAAYHKEINSQYNRWEEWKKDKENSAIVSAPNLTHFGNRITLGAGLKENNYDNLVKWIEDPDTIKIGTRMKNHAAIYTTENKLSDLEIQQIAKYLLSLKPSDDSMATYIKE